jgi:hypothetical protein
MATCATRLQSVASSAPGVPWRVRTTLVFGAATPPAFAQACACPSGTTLGAQRALAGPGRPHSARAARGAGGGAATSTHPQQAAQHHTHSAYNLLHDNSTCA